MTINTANLILTLQKKINDSSNETDILSYSRAIQQLRTGKIFSVQLLSQLPNSNTSTGYLYYVNETEAVYFPSVLGWLQLYSATPDRAYTQILSWGTGSNGRLGDGTVSDKCSPVREICSATDWRQVSAGGSQTSALKSTGQIWSWGLNSSGQLGDGTTVNKCSPVREISSSTDWCQVSAGYAHTAALKTTGQLWSWGYGRLGDGTTVNKFSPVREISSSTDWCQVTVSDHTSALKTSGQLWSWGYGRQGQLGDGTTVNKCSPVREITSSTDWCQVSAGYFRTAALKTTGQLWSWGFGASGGLGDGTTVTKCSPVREISSSTDWCQVSAGDVLTAAIKTSGQLWSWGFGASGRLGDGTTVDKCSPVREISSSTDWCQVGVGICHASAVKTSGQLWSWGFGDCGRLGDGTTVSKCSPVREISSSTNWSQVSARGIATTALNLIACI